MRPNLTNSFQECLEITWEHKRTYTVDDIVERASRAIEEGILNGSTVFRVFADVDSIGGLRPLGGNHRAPREVCRHRRDRSRRFPPGSDRPRPRHRRADGGGDADGRRRGRRTALARTSRRGRARPISTSVSSWRRNTTRTSTCWWMTPTIRTAARSSTSPPGPSARATRAGSRRAIAARSPPMTRSMPTR